VKISFFEIYNEKAYDLLETSKKRIELKLREKGPHFQLAGLKAIEVKNFDEAIDIIRHGLR
jgi:hypothetical protein